MVAPKEMGGLGIGSLRDANLSLLLKWWFRYKNDNSKLWAKVVHSIHFSNRNYSSFPLKKNISGPWQNILKAGLDVGNLGIDISWFVRCIIGNGSGIMFWLDNWSGKGILKEVFPTLFHLESEKFCRVKDRLPISKDDNPRWCWKSVQANASEMLQLEQIEDIISSFQLDVGADRWVWGDEDPIPFSSSAVRRDIELRLFDYDEYKFPWQNWVPLKVNIFVWRAAYNRIPSSVALIRRGINVASQCSLCNYEGESADHVLIACPFAVEVWDRVMVWCNCPRLQISSIRDLLSFPDSWPSNYGLKRLLLVVFFSTLWCIWKTRNARIFNKKVVSPMDVIGDIKSESFMWVKYRGKYENLLWSNWCNFSF